MDEAVSAPLQGAAPSKNKRQFSTDQQARAIVRSGEAGRWRDIKTKCLYLESHDGKSFHWIHEPRWKGKTTYGSYGGYPAVSVAEARERAAQTRLDQRQGKDPAAAKKAAQVATVRAAMTLSAAYDKWYAWMLPDLRATTAKSYRNPFTRNEKCRALASKPINDFTDEDARAIMSERFGDRVTAYWQACRERLFAVVDYAEGQGWREEERRNPFSWKRRLQIKFPKSKNVKKGRRPMGYFWLPEFMPGIRDNTDIPSLSLMIVAFSGSRGHTVRLARWNEVDFENLIWTRPSAHMKQKAPHYHDHAVHITPGMLRIFRFLYAIRTCDDDGLIFPSPTGKVVEGTIWKKLSPENVDTHGLRQDLENWRQEQTNFRTDVGAVQLDHVIRDPQNDLIAANLVTRLYATSPLYNKRREMMTQWDLFLTGGDYGGDLLEQWKARPQKEALDPEAVKLRRREYIKGYMRAARAKAPMGVIVSQPGRGRGRPRKESAAPVSS